MPQEARVNRRRYLQAIGGTVATLSIAGCQSGSEDSQTLTAGTAPGFPPFKTKQDGELVGLDVELLEAVIAASEYELSGREELETVDGGQLTAARAIGLSKLEGIRYVVVPQGLRLALPSWTNELVYLIKYSSLASFITVQELYGRTSTLADETYQYTELFVLVAILYLAIVVSASALMDRVESHTATAGVGHTRQ